MDNVTKIGGHKTVSIHIVCIKSINCSYKFNITVRHICTLLSIKYMLNEIASDKTF